MRRMCILPHPTFQVYIYIYIYVCILYVYIYLYDAYTYAHIAILHILQPPSLFYVCAMLGADVSMRDTSQRTPLHHASRMGHAHVVKCLLKAKGVEIEAIDRHGKVNWTLNE